MSDAVVKQQGSTVYFRGGSEVRVGLGYDLPRDTLDPRYRDCTQHHVACICREAEHAEELHEMRAELRDIREALKGAVEGHPTKVYSQMGNRRKDLECRCIACDVLRRHWTGVSLWDNEVHL